MPLLFSLISNFFVRDDVEASLFIPNTSILFKQTTSTPQKCQSMGIENDIAEIVSATDSEMELERASKDHQRVYDSLRDCLNDLHNPENTPLSDDDVESMATLIQTSMSGPARDFHSTQHIFDISNGATPVQTLAALFHDIVYYNIDGGLNGTHAGFLKDVIVEEIKADGGATISIGTSDSFRNGGDSKDWTVAMVLSVFGINPGQVLNPFGGLNELLSAIIAARSLKNKVSDKDLLRIIACIEATIPFRGNDVGDILYSRLEKMNEPFGFAMAQEELIKAVQLAIDLGNRDVANFAHSPNKFLDNSWSLMPETNDSLRKKMWNSGEDFLVSDFTLAVKKMRGFFGFLNPEVVFHQFRGYPDDETFQNLVDGARDNLGLAQKYMDGKMMCASFMGSVAALTGGDTTVSYWAAKEDESDNCSKPATSCENVKMPELRIYENADADERVFKLLDGSVDKEIGAFDIKQTATAPLLYGMMGDTAIKESLKFAAVPMDEENAKKFLKSLPKEALVPLLSTLCETCSTSRRDEVAKILTEFKD